MDAILHQAFRLHQDHSSGIGNPAPEIDVMSRTKLFAIPADRDERLPFDQGAGMQDADVPIELQVVLKRLAGCEIVEGLTSTDSFGIDVVGQATRRYDVGIRPNEGDRKST